MMMMLLLLLLLLCAKHRDELAERMRANPTLGTRLLVSVIVRLSQLAQACALCDVVCSRACDTVCVCSHCP
jgi:hypothetical protein